MKKLLTIITCALLCAVSFASCTNNGDTSGDKTITVAASTSPHAEILEQCVQPLADLPEGAKIAVPNDATNEARALMLLEANGLITLKEGAGLTATKNDIVENPKNFDIVEMEAAIVPRVRSEVGVAVINGNYAIPNGLKTSDALAIEDPDSEAAQTYANVLVVKEGNENLEKITALKEALLSQTVKDYIAETYEGAVIAIF
ncbi:MAG: hypothetical protein DBX61_09220 [Clostridiales bacterium]|nr:MAG: hypothetical protein DBX61_09220 [Clostridiales bacterium]